MLFGHNWGCVSLWGHVLKVFFHNFQPFFNYDFERHNSFLGGENTYSLRALTPKN